METLYHYTDNKFDSFDASKCDGIWLTDIQPNDKEMLNEVGAQSFEWCAVCRVNTSELEELTNGDNYDVEEQLESDDCDYIRNLYDGFEDLAFADAGHVEIIEWVKVGC